MITLNTKDAKNLIDTSTNRIDFLLKRFKELDGLTNDVYDALGVLDDLIIEYDDLNTSFRRLQNMYTKLYNKYNKMKGVNDEHLQKSANSTSEVAIPTT